jgi:hypothetical protein
MPKNFEHKSREEGGVEGLRSKKGEKTIVPLQYLRMKCVHFVGILVILYEVVPLTINRGIVSYINSSFEGSQLRLAQPSKYLSALSCVKLKVHS